MDGIFDDVITSAVRAANIIDVHYSRLLAECLPWSWRKMKAAA